MAEGYIISWVELEHKSPVNISKIIRYSQLFESSFPIKITLENLNEVKDNLFTARNYLDAMVISLIQLFYDKEILKEKEDKILYTWFIENLARFLRFLDEKEEELLIKYDVPYADTSRVGVSRLSSYAKLLRTCAESIIYDSIEKAINEYNNLKQKEPKLFLYILFQILQVTMSVVGGMTREKMTRTRRGVLQSLPLHWSALLSDRGKTMIKQGFEEETGIDLSDLDIPEEQSKIIEGEINENENY